MKQASVAFAMGAGVVLAGLLLWHGGSLSGQVAKDGAAKEKEPRKIQTSGSATVRVKPNRARLFFVIEDTGPTIKSVREDNKKHVESVIAAIVGKKIPELKMKSTNVQMDVLHSKDDKHMKLPEVLGYRVTYTFTVLVASDDPQKLSSYASKVLDTALENGANAVQQITFFCDDLTEARREALTNATAAAMANAKALAAGDKRTVTDLINIDSNPEYSIPYNMQNTMQPNAKVADATELVAGDVELTCRVNITATFGEAK
jgi:uncharacterized protein YggE